MSKRWIIGITGSSGMPYALRLIEILSNALQNGEIHVIVSAAALRVLNAEHDLKVSPSNLSTEVLFGRRCNNVFFHHYSDIAAPFASGSFLVSGMIICPCSMATLAHVAHGSGTNLIHRAADVMLKEGRKLVLVARETPLSAIHLQNMLTLAQLGATILPAMPGFYQRPKSVGEIVDAMVMKILDCIGVENDLLPRWGEVDMQRRSKAVDPLVTLPVINPKSHVA